MTRVSVRDFSFRYRRDQRPILSDINLDFSSNERILILGPSGGGKSTLLLALLRLYTAFDIYYAQGKITFDGRSGDELSRKELLELFGVVFQSPAHQFCLKYPEDEAAFGLENLQIDPARMQGLIDSSFGRFGFVKRAQPIQTLSGGEQQVLAAASTTVLESRMLVMDEPTAHLDPSGRKDFRSSLQSWLSGDKGFLLVEHHIDLWLDLVQRVVVLDEMGKILFDEKGVDVLSRERNLLFQMGVWLPEQRVFSSGLLPDVLPNMMPAEISGETPNMTPGAEPDRAAFQASGSKTAGRSSSAKPALEFKNADIGYDRKRIVKKLNLQVKPGELVALVGRNGCGKSTVLQSLIGLADLQNGSIHIDGNHLCSSKKSCVFKKKILMSDTPAYLFQNPEHQFIHPTVQEELRDSSLSKADSDEREKVLLGRHGLYEKRHHNPFSLSGGEKRRLSLASLLAGHHSLYLLDEPTFGQDAKTAKELVGTIRELYEKGKTLVVVSHDLPLFKDMLSRIVVLYKGAIAFDGSPRELSEYSSDRLDQWGVEL